MLPGWEMVRELCSLPLANSVPNRVGRRFSFSFRFSCKRSLGERTSGGWE